MLTFLRKIRKSLIASGSSRKYLMYAVGEILLVMIGILLALQVNNWNEGRKDRKAESLILEELKENLNDNLHILEKSIIENEKRAKEVDRIMWYLENKTNFSDSLGIYLKRLYFVDEFSIISSSYETLKSTNINLLSSNTLKKEIINLYEYTYSRDMKMIDNIDYARSESNNTFFQGLFFNTYQYMIPNDYKQLRKNQLFKNIISGRQTWKMVKVGHMKNMFDETQQLLKLVEIELAKTDKR